MTYLTCWAGTTKPSKGRTGMFTEWQQPLGPAHAVELGSMVTICGAPRVIDRGGDWPPKDSTEVCADCVRLVGETT